jgi:molecular chaperone GrpE
MDPKKEPAPDKLAAPEKPELIRHEDQKMIKETDAQRTEDLENQLRRLQAEFENYKKRTAKEKEALMLAGSAVTIVKLLPVLDEMDIAIAATHHNANAKEMRHGLEMLHKKFLQVLEKEGLVEMKSLGEQFDPYRHEAVRTVEADEDNKVVEVMKKGYLFRDNVLRHAMVAVGRKREEKAEEKKTEGKKEEKAEQKKEGAK